MFSDKAFSTCFVCINLTRLLRVSRLINIREYVLANPPGITKNSFYPIVQ